MHVVCMRLRWANYDEPGLLSSAAITDDPPPANEAAGNDRCIIRIEPENIGAWPKPTAPSLDAMYAILDDRGPPYYEHKLVA